MRIAIIDTLGLVYNGHSIKKHGLGGSESAVICISQELVKLGFDVTVYNNCNDSDTKPGKYDGVNYCEQHSPVLESKPYDIVISSRSTFPFLQNNQYHTITSGAKYKILWMHDTFCEGDEYLEGLITSGKINRVFTLSDFHTNYVTNCDHGNKKRMYEVLKHYVWQTRNGVAVRNHDIDLNKKDKNHFVYNASATKGLVPLVKNIWPRIKNIIPSATLSCVGGYYRFGSDNEPDQQEKVVRDLANDPVLKKLDITFTGVIPQSQVSDILSQAGFMIYPPAFPETFGISSLESLAHNTPIITSNFGALEETAIDIACYKTDYPIEPNSLFPHIDSKKQINDFVKLVELAYTDDYLYQQKQHACDIIKPICDWNTVALQWKQHFYNVFEIPLPVQEYRTVDRINKTVNRVFNRKTTNSETTNTYISYGSQQYITVVSPFRNAEKYIQHNILSVAQQDYENYQHILIDDNSDDNSYIVAKQTIEGLPSEISKKFVLIKNKQNMGAIYNQFRNIQKYAKNDDIVILLDGDDWLVSNNTIFHYYNDLYSQGYEFTYGSMWSLCDNIPLIAQDYPENIKQNRDYRKYQFNWKVPYTHLRTFKKYLLNTINDSVFKDETGVWMKSGHDVSLFYELIEMVESEKIYCSKEIMCVYNDSNPQNDYKIRPDEQNKNASIALNKKTKKTILIAVPTSKYIEPDTFKSIYDLQVPHGYETHFQFFYGYQTDQVRNLSAEWAKRYDYMLCVDSDIVLPSDALVKMIEADRDIISGLYIQRIPGTHTLELYWDSADGSMLNIPYNAIKDKGLVKVSACGFGAVLIKSQVFRKMSYPHFVYKSAIDHADTVSEDVYFCKKAKKYGFETWADTSILCEHIGQTVYRV